jgi:anti-sigma B factor antagonist
MLEGAELTSAVMDDGTPVVSATGELDMLAAPGLARRLGRAAGKRHPNLVLDLSDATFIDSTILGVILGFARTLENHGSSLVVVADHPHITRVLDVTGLVRVFPVVATREQALAAL